MSELENLANAAQTAEGLASAMAHITGQLGFEYFAIMHHVDGQGAESDAIYLHNYPSGWAEFYNRHALGISDPVHRASHVTSVAFCWSRIPDMIALTPNDHHTLALGRALGVGGGLTVPAHVPGEARGSCSFACRAGCEPSPGTLHLGQLVGAFAFEAARRLWIARGWRTAIAPCLTDRQRDCVLWIARGKSDWEISRILGVAEETVASHVKNACERYDVSKRTSLVIRTLFDGTISFGDALKRDYPPFRG